ncbi:hypothetical protein AAP_02341 [Ascosphaera apis ARSEF 7405]|uniref:Uncharacterized protein n=1 Tax=Ascosphaera apis ARSEF 7405 TaxID=392613 RepID=A0A168A725_9EURO|nr:hypothetical protein AAP_02341 [Ascosphaera apis ARSEF 7405]
MGNDGNFGGNWPPVSKPLPFVIGLSHLSPLLLEFGEYPDLEARFGFRGRMPGDGRGPNGLGDRETGAPISRPGDRAIVIEPLEDCLCNPDGLVCSMVEKKFGSRLFELVDLKDLIDDCL